MLSKRRAGKFPPLLLILASILAAILLGACDQSQSESAAAQTPAAAVAADSIEQPEVPAAAPTRASAYAMRVFAEPSTRNAWNYVGGPGGSVWTGYVVGSYHPSLYGLSAQRFDWVPTTAADFPSELEPETAAGEEYWTTLVPLRPGIVWSDGEELTAEDFVFTVDTVLDLGLGSNWVSAVDPNFVDHAETIDQQTIKIWFKARNDDGEPQVPGLSIWQFGLGFMPIMPEHYWRPVVEGAKGAGDNIAQIEALYAHSPDGEPTAAGFEFKDWEPGAFFQNAAASNYSFQNSQVTQYSDGSIREPNPVLGYEETILGDGDGQVALDYVVGPHVEDAYFYIYGNQDAAMLALTNGDVDYVFNPLGLEQGFRNRAQAADNLELVNNDNNGTRYLGFNVRKAPFD